MAIPYNFSEIQDTRVALRLKEYEEKTYNHYWRDLQQERSRSRELHRRWEWNNNENANPEYLLSAEALELKILPGENSQIEVLNFTWFMIEYTEDYIWIQINWEFPPRVSEHIDEYDMLEVYFWGNEFSFFYSKEISKEVRYGTKLQVPIIR